MTTPPGEGVAAGGQHEKCEPGPGPRADALGAPASSPGRARPLRAPSQRGLKQGLWGQERTAVLMLGETSLTETPPLRCCYGRIGQQVCIPLTGNRAKRILRGVLDVTTGDRRRLITEAWDEVTPQDFPERIRAHWRGWRRVLFEDRGTPHAAEGSVGRATDLGIQTRWLPRATPGPNAMDHLWRQVKGRGVADRAPHTIEESAATACRYLREMTRLERRQKAGGFSGRFWLTA